jgi:Obg family GTPase CgtA-like protein
VVISPRAVDEAGFTVTAEDGGFRVRGQRPERWVRQTDFSNDEAVGYLGDRLARLGVEEALVKAGARPGVAVMIGPEANAVVFDWYPSIIAGVGRAPSPRGTDLRVDARIDLDERDLASLDLASLDLASLDLGERDLDELDLAEHDLADPDADAGEEAGDGRH